MLRVAVGRPASVRVEVRDYDGTLVVPDTAPEVVVTDVAGDVVQSGGTIQDLTADGVYAFPLSSLVIGDIADFTATASWQVSGVDDQLVVDVSVVSAHLFELSDLRGFDAALTDPDLYPAHALRTARDYATDRLERAALVAFTYRAGHVTGTMQRSAPALLLPHAHIAHSVSVHADGVLLDEDAYRVVWRTGELVAEDGPWPEGAVLDVSYVQGLGAQAPGPVARAAMLLAVEYLVPSSLPARATSQSTDLGDFRISVASPESSRWTGIPEADAIIHEYGLRRPPVGDVLWQ